ncbi:hypothetical protein NHX12_020866 [Muraenolepis orangiensis]|uniref:A-kinase anchor protein 14 n=1 Tax=Muraenolepis orangiensis TaxID=630683 RepID=A0A9Q0IWQ7_9TELE|nr:hypothetical protein NHX12_020866 [Muraenolepis orangiensis]
MEEKRPSSSSSSEAEDFVTTVLERAQRAVMNDIERTRTPDKNQERKYEAKPMDWVSCGDFNVELGRKQITEYMRTCWEADSRWLLNVVFLDSTITTEEEEEDKEEEEKDHSILHRYRARWSIPTRHSPIPRETASVYFFVRVWSSSGPRCAVPVEVYYVVESSAVHLVAGGGSTRFRERWLTDVMESKALLMREVDF